MPYSILFGQRPLFQNSTNRSNYGKTDIYEQPDAFILHIEVPGLCQNDIEVSATTNTLEIKANKEVQLPQQFATESKNSRTIAFHRTFRFGAAIDEENISAMVNNGLLEIRLPKQSPRKIAISVQ